MIGRIPGLMARGSLMGSGTLMALLHILASPRQAGRSSRALEGLRRGGAAAPNRCGSPTIAPASVGVRVVVLGSRQVRLHKVGVQSCLRSDKGWRVHHFQRVIEAGRRVAVAE